MVALLFLLAACGEAAEQILIEFPAPDGDYQLRLTWVAKRTVLIGLKPRNEAHHGVRVEWSDPPRVESVARC